MKYLVIWEDDKENYLHLDDVSHNSKEDAIQEAIEYDEFDNSFSKRLDVRCIVQIDENYQAKTIYDFGELEKLALDKTQELKDDQEHKRIEKEGVYHD